MFGTYISHSFVFYGASDKETLVTWDCSSVTNFALEHIRAVYDQLTKVIIIFNLGAAD